MPQTSRTLSPHLQKMQIEMELRGLSPQTLQQYFIPLKLLEKHFDKPAFEVSPDELKQYLYHRIKSGISNSSLNISCSAFKLFFNKVLNYNWSDDVIIRPKRPKKLPYVLSQNEVLAIIDQLRNIKHKTILLTMYSSGLRISETLSLRVSDIDSKNMLIRINKGKGSKDRLTVLSLENLKLLRHYWKLYRPTDLLFPGPIEVNLFPLVIFKKSFQLLNKKQVFRNPLQSIHFGTVSRLICLRIVLISEPFRC